MHIGESTTCRISEEKLLDLEIGHFEAAGGRFFPAQCLTHDQSRNFLLDIWVGGGLALLVCLPSSIPYFVLGVAQTSVGGMSAIRVYPLEYVRASWAFAGGPFTLWTEDSIQVSG